jgi:hypothetical protein
VRAPEPPPWPRSFQQELDVCREGLLRSVWDAATEKWRHCIDWEPTNAPGLAALLWMDSYLAADPAQRARSMARAELGVRNVLRDAGPAGLMSPAACHILRWELPFLAGRLPEAMAGLEPQIRSGIAFQKAEGGWRFTPGAPDQTDLGRAGDSVLGTNVYMAALLLRYARITGDTEALAAGEKALAFMERFRVPRGAGTWECPMYEPDQLASAGAVGAYVEGFRASGNPRWLRDAVYWAESGLPFVYHWTTPGRPMMFGATTSNIGSTFYTHSWIGMPVQWVGLVYAYRLLGLADCLDAASPAAVGALRPVVGLKPSDWRRIAELITVSAMHQQEADGPRAGTYPDSITDFQKRNPPYLNPEDILVNVLALKGHDPDIRTARVDIGGRPVVVSTGARIVVAAGANGALRLRLAPIPGRTAHVMVCGLKASAASVDGEALTRAAEPVRTDPGWWVDDAKGRTYLVLPPRTDDGPLTLEVSGRPEG